MVTWAVAHGADLPPTDGEVTNVLSSIRASCNAQFSQEDSTSIANHLKAYFAGNPRNMLRLIFTPEVSTNPDLIAIQGILSTYNGCSLDSIAEVDPFKCGKEKTITFHRSGLWKYPGLPLTYSTQPPPQPRIAAAKAAAAPLALSAPCVLDHNAERAALEDLYDSLSGGQWFRKSGWLSTDISTWYGVTLDGSGYVKKIELFENNLEGKLPATITNFCKLEELDISGNAIGDTIPADIDRLSNLVLLNASYNKFSGPIPDNIGELMMLNYLNLSDNELTGAIPPSLGDNLSLSSLILSNNHLTSMPAPANGGYDLYMLRIEHNEISGTIPIAPPDGSYRVTPMGSVAYNKLTFSDLQAINCYLVDEGSPMQYAPQDPVDEEASIMITPGGTITLTAHVDLAVTNPPCEYQWFKYVDGVNDLPLTPTGPTHEIADASAADAGQYYYTVTNAGPNNCGSYSYSDLALYSHKTDLLAPPDTSLMTFTFCVEYDSTNTTLSKFKFKVNWNDVIAKCLANAAKEDTILAELAVEKLLNSYATTYYNSYRVNCLGRVKEHLDYTYDSKEYHYTLYYFDQADNLVQTVPPKGVHPLSEAQLAQFSAGTKTNPMHGLLTRYMHSSLEQVLKQSTPDGGESIFLYDSKKRLRLSQNAQQNLDDQFAYTKYDDQGRAIEIGELYTSLTVEALKDSLNLSHFPVDGHADYILSDITKTHYDFERVQMIDKFPQHFLRTRVAWVEVIDKGASDTTATYYTYDMHGNVKALLQHIPGLSDKRTDYVYDLVNDKMNYVFYQYGKNDQFTHHFVYDADNRIREVYTSGDGFIWNKEAAYEYYLHGPLARLELGPYRSQGLDYYYTLQGWIKGVNMPFTGDPGKDGGGQSITGRDVFAYALGYYENDYKPMNSTVPLSDTRDKMNARLQQHLGYKGLYNGNISWMVTDLAKIGEIEGDRKKGMQSMMYHYDQLHRITKSRSLTDYNAAEGFTSRNSSAEAYDENYTYDSNGNILALFRRDEAGMKMHDFSYEYYTSTNRLFRVEPTTTDTTYIGRVASNRILYKDVILKDGAYVPADIPAVVRGTENVIALPDFGTEEGSDFAAMITEDVPYIYNAVGDLILNQDEGFAVSWTPQGKMRELRFHNDSILVRFRYDANGNRIEKRVMQHDTTLVTRYIHDVKGHTIAIYSDTTMSEEYIYGLSRLGVYKGDGPWEGDQVLGYRNYELGNHLGNVLGIITDNIGMDGVDSVWATVLKANDYYPFGLDMRGRNWEDSIGIRFRYGFNGKERDFNLGKGAMTYDFGARIYDPKIARFFNTDAREDKYPGYSPYNYAADNPIYLIDEYGEGPRPAPPLVEAAIKNLSSFIYNALKAANNTSTWHANEWARGRASWDAPGKMLGAMGEAVWKYKIESAAGANVFNLYAHGTDFYGPVISKITQVDVVEVVPVVNIKTSRGTGVEKIKELPSYDANGILMRPKKLETTNKKVSAYVLNYEVKTLNPNSLAQSIYSQLSDGINQAIKNGALPGKNKDDHVIGVLVTDAAAWRKVALDPLYGPKLKQKWEQLNKAGGVLRLTENLHNEAQAATEALKTTILVTPEK